MQNEHLLLIPPPVAFLASTTAILRAAERSGARVTLLTHLPATAFAGHACVDTVLPLPQGCGAALEGEGLHMLDARFAAAPFRRAISFSEEHVELAASLNERYALGGNSRRCAVLARDKHRMRAAMLAAGIPVPAFRAVDSFAAFQAAVAEIGFPCISKPAKACASEGVVKLEAGADLSAAYTFSAGVPQGAGSGRQVLVEEYVSGPEVSVEIVVSAGVAQVAGVTEKTTEAEPYFGEVMHVFPAPIGEDVEAVLGALARETVRALEIEEGGAHLEVRLTPRGPVVIECAARLAGDSLPIVVALATGVDLYECVLRQAMGRNFSLQRRRVRCGGIRFVQTDLTGRLETAGFDRKRLSRVRGVLGWGAMREHGERVSRPPGGETHRLAYLIAVAPDAPGVRKALETAEAAFGFTLTQDAA